MTEYEKVLHQLSTKRECEDVVEMIVVAYIIIYTILWVICH